MPYGEVKSDDGVASHGIGQRDGRGVCAFGVGDIIDPSEGVAGVNGDGACRRGEHGDGDGGDAVAAGDGGCQGVCQDGVCSDDLEESEVVVSVAVADAGGGVDAGNGIDMEVHGEYTVSAGCGR